MEADRFREADSGRLTTDTCTRIVGESKYMRGVVVGRWKHQGKERYISLRLDHRMALAMILPCEHQHYMVNSRCVVGSPLEMMRQHILERERERERES